MCLRENLQIDDLYLGSEQWDPVTNTDTATPYRITASDFEIFANQIASLRAVRVGRPIMRKTVPLIGKAWGPCE